MNKSYYAFVAHNCVAVFDSWPGVLKGQKYAVKPFCKKFSTFYEAEAYALERFLQYYPYGYRPIKQLLCNKMMFTKNQRPENLMAAISSSRDITAQMDERCEAPEDSTSDGEVNDGKYHIIIH